MKIGFIGERHNIISMTLFRQSLMCPSVAVEWFIDSTLAPQVYKKKYRTIKKRLSPTVFFHTIKNDCKRLCKNHGIPYYVPINCSINTGLPSSMYSNPSVDYVLIAGCDQLLDEQALTLARNKIINYHYSILPDYRGKFSLFWQWYNDEPRIGFSFHEVDLSIDAGQIIYQDTIDHIPGESYAAIRKKIFDASGAAVCKLFECLKTGKHMTVDKPVQSRLFTIQQYYSLLTADPSKSMNDICEVFSKIGYFLLPNGLPIKKILHHGSQKIISPRLSWRGIVIPLRDGYIIGSTSRRIPFWMIRLLFGKKCLE
ncbi:MAG: hypothetical protein GF384_08380 [Elusimicrobia bacterium]|nr:hypothetical protein [Elusimicrobiota bacterium]MBD3412644.1 hypothetical protein [Elusimicrobiota bacterium]